MYIQGEKFWNEGPWIVHQETGKQPKVWKKPCRFCGRQSLLALSQVAGLATWIHDSCWRKEDATSPTSQRWGMRNASRWSHARVKLEKNHPRGRVGERRGISVGAADYDEDNSCAELADRDMEMLVNITVILNSSYCVWVLELSLLYVV